jgi:hypothetical protein
MLALQPRPIPILRIRTIRDLLENAPRHSYGPFNLERADLEGANLIKANLTGANLRHANLIGANLEGANLEGVNLSYANLTDANLTSAKLRFADLKHVNLTRVNLTRANLSEGANLIKVNLNGANLIGANLEGANLEGAKLKGAKLKGAKLRGADLTDADLTGVIDANLTGANLTDAILLTPIQQSMYALLQEVMNNITVYDITEIEDRPATRFFQDHDESHPYIIRNSIGLYTGAAIDWIIGSSSGTEFVECADDTVTEWTGINSYRNYIKPNARRFIKITVSGSPTMVIKPDWYDSRQIPGTKFFQLVDTNKPVFKFMISVLASGNIPSDFEAVGSDHCNQTSPIGTYTLEPITIEQLQQYTSVVEPPLAPPLAPRPQPTGLFSRARARMSRMFNPNPSGGKNRKMRNTTRKTHKKLKTKKSKMLNKKRRLKTRKMK